MNKRGQVTIFIIVAVIAVAAVVFFLLVQQGVVPQIGEKPEKNPNAFLESCVEDTVKEGVKTLALHGGYISNSLNKTFKFEDESSTTDISYLCYSENAAYPCVNQEPKLINHLEQEISDYISEDIETCFNQLKTSFEKSGYTIEQVYSGFDVNLEAGKIVIPINAKITSTKSGETTTHENFQIAVLSKLYDLANVAQEIVNSESTTGEFSHYQLFNYPQFDINKYRNADSSVIYTVQHIESEEEFRLAVIGSVIKPGWY